jgi:hypothetical protein
MKKLILMSLLGIALSGFTTTDDENWETIKATNVRTGTPTQAKKAKRQNNEQKPRQNTQKQNTQKQKVDHGDIIAYVKPDENGFVEGEINKIHQLYEKYIYDNSIYQKLRRVCDYMEYDGNMEVSYVIYNKQNYKYQNKKDFCNMHWCGQLAQLANGVFPQLRDAYVLLVQATNELSNKIKSEPEYWKTMQKIGKDVVICLSIPVSNNED